MTTVNMLAAKTQLSKLVEAIEKGEQSEIIIARNGKPAARLVPLEAKPKVRLGLLDGKYADFTLEEFNAADEEIARLFNEGDWYPGEHLAESPAEPPRRKAGKP